MLQCALAIGRLYFPDPKAATAEPVYTLPLDVEVAPLELEEENHLLLFYLHKLVEACNSFEFSTTVKVSGVLNQQFLNAYHNVNK